MTSKTFRLLTISVFIALLLPALVQQGMFLDGISYACIARNMANGLGDFAHPHYTASLYPVCYEQPPLVFWLQSGFFRFFGDYFWVERLYSFCAAMLVAFGIVLNWRLFQKPSSVQGLEWLPVLLWIIAPISFWAFSNNMLECTMSVFVLFATYFATKSVLENKSMLLVLAAFSITAAVLCKGPVGFFPVAAPLAMALAFEPKRLAAAAGRSILLLLLTMILLTLFVRFVPGMPKYLDNYLQTRLLPTLSGTRDEHVGSPFSFLLDLISQLALPGILLVLLLAKRGFRAFSIPKSALYFFALGLAGTLPLVFSPKQSVHYLLPAIPFFALGFASVFSRNLAWFKTSAKARSIVFEKIAWLVLVTVVVVSLSFWGKFRRDETTIREVQTICNQVGEGATMGVPEHFSNRWLLHAYFARIGNVSLDHRNAHDFWLTEKGGAGPDGFAEIEVEVGEFRIFKRIQD